MMLRTLRTPRVVLLAALLTVLLGMAASFAAETAEAQEDIQARALEIERQLLCPQCTNLRLDVCETQICFDMRAVIRERLAAGESEEQVIDYFTGRYGDRILADVPRSGFNLVLFGWVGGSILLVAAVGTFVLMRLRRTASPAPAAPLTEADDRWLDEQLAREPDVR